jgi:hypothetical protein
VSNFDTNKYRMKFPRIGTKAYPRVKAIESIAEYLRLGNTLHTKTYDNKNISPEHRKVLLDCARLWNKLTELENGVKERAKKPKAKGLTS